MAFGDGMRRNGPLWFVGALVMLPVLMYALVLIAVAWNQTRFIYPGAGRAAPALESGWRTISVPTLRHGTLTSYVRDGAAGRPTVVFLHGNWGSLSSTASATRSLGDRGMTIVVPEWPGYAGNPGIPTADGLDDAAISTFDAIVRSGTRPSSIVVVGNSLGSAPAIALAAARRPAGLVLISAFTDLRIMARRRFPLAPGFLLTDAFDNLEAMKAVKTPIMVIHGSRDDYVPTSMGRELADASKTPVRLVDAGHDAAYVQAAQDMTAERVEEWTSASGKSR
jgi:fermentation-respiration switch protein FrsA (DUF1100 family)